ncbi:BACON domain-containing protein [Nakamurella lactea]|uniref:BACON domain-containing protein n=1 Tax=Nakamurella lactea TaxID=459515 RepID=UPI0003F4CB90|nr:Ig-like domain repeat protein [Nakamurella lactea]
MNLPAIVDDACLQTCTLTRTLTSVADTTADYTIEVDAPGDATVTVTPQTFTLAPGATQELTVTIDVAALTGPGWLFGDLKLSTDGTHAGGAEIADVHYPIAVVPAEAEIALDQESITDTIAVPEARDYPLQVLNNGGAPLHWAVDAASADCALPAWLSLDPTSGTVPAEDSATATLTVATQNLTAGEHSARLCLSSNDPHTELATLAVTINVQEIPDVAVDPEQLTLSAPAGGTDTANVTIANTGYGTLNWRLDDPEAGASPERLELLRNGVLLVPNSTTSSRGIMAFDAQDGTLIDDQFLPYPAWSPGGSTLYTPLNVLPMPDGQSFLVSDQVKGMITRWDLEGNFLGTFGPKTVEGDSSVMNNVRGMAWTAQDTLLVTVASGANANSILELSQDGELLGYFVDPGEDGLDSPWSILVRDNDVLVSASGTKQIHRFSLTGEPLPAFGEVTWAEQLAETASGNVLAANWQTTPARGVLEFSATGDYLGNLYPDNTGNNYGGVAELGNGNLLITSSKGVFEIGRDGTAVAEQTTGRGRYITPVTLPDARPCQLPTDVPWLSVSAPSGATTRGQDASVQVTADATGLAAGDHSALLCVSSDDPDRPTVTLPVTLTVGAASTTTLTADVASQTYLPAKPATLTANVDAPIDTTVSGTVEFRRGAEVIGTAPVTNRTAKLEVPVDTPAGTHALTATFVAEDPSALLGSTSAALFFKVNMALSATTVGAKKVRLDAATARASGRSWGLQVTAKVTIAAPSTAPADGVAHINIGGSKVASVPVSGGTGVSAVIPVPAGLNPVIVTYLPDDPSVQRSTGRVSATVGR